MKPTLRDLLWFFVLLGVLFAWYAERSHSEKQSRLLAESNMGNGPLISLKQFLEEEGYSFSFSEVPGKGIAMEIENKRTGKSMFGRYHNGPGIP